MKLKNHRKRVWIKTTLIATIAVGLLAGYFILAKDGEINPFNSSSGKDQASDNTSQQEKPGESQKIIPPNTDHATLPDPQGSNGNQIVPVVVSSNVDGSIVYIRGGINTPVSEGTCFAELEGPNGEKIRKETALLPNAGTTDCKTISIPISELTKGKWNVTLNYSGTNKEGKSSVDTFTIQ